MSIYTDIQSRRNSIYDSFKGDMSHLTHLRYGEDVLNRMMKMYDDVFFEGQISEKVRSMNRILVISTTPGNNRVISDDSKIIVFVSEKVCSKLKPGEVFKVNGVMCKDKLQCIQIILEHQIIHLLMVLFNHEEEETYEHSELFKCMAGEYFGHEFFDHDGLYENTSEVYEVDLIFDPKDLTFEDVGNYFKKVDLDRVLKSSGNIQKYIRDINISKRNEDVNYKRYFRVVSYPGKPIPLDVIENFLGNVLFQKLLGKKLKNITLNRTKNGYDATLVVSGIKHSTSPYRDQYKCFQKSYTPFVSENVWRSKLEFQRLFRLIIDKFCDKDIRIQSSAQNIITDSLLDYIIYVVRDAKCVMDAEGKRVMIQSKDVIVALKERGDESIAQRVEKKSLHVKIDDSTRKQIFKSVKIALRAYGDRMYKSYNSTRDILVNVVVCRAEDIIKEICGNISGGIITKSEVVKVLVDSDEPVKQKSPKKMDIVTKIYRLPVPDNIGDKLDSAYKRYAKNFQGNRFNADVIKDYASDIKSYAKDIHSDVSDEDLSSLPIIEQNSSTHRGLSDIRDLIREQYNYTRYPNGECDTYYIVSYVNGHEYGGIFAFYYGSTPDRIYIQGITKYPVPGMFSLAFPSKDKHLPRLNSLLDPKIAELAKSLGAKHIYVRPVANQGNILTKHYGYYESPDIKTLDVCDLPMGGGKVYRKDV